MSGEYASPPCFMHELEPGRDHAPALVDAWADVARWRRAERKRLLDARLALDVAARHDSANRIAAALDRTIGKFGGRTVSGYWPFRGEPDLRNWSIRVIERGGRVALPVVIRKDWPVGLAVRTDSRDIGYAFELELEKLAASGRLKEIMAGYGVTYTPVPVND